jgi:hypothetical protein
MVLEAMKGEVKVPKTATATPAANEAPAKSRRTQWREGTTVTLTEKGLKNPKKANSAAFGRYQAYLGFGKRIAPGSKNAPTVAELMKAGIRMDDYRHDLAHGFIESNEPFDLAAEAE